METDFQLVSSILFFIVGVIGTALYAWRVRKAHFTEPIYQFLFFYALFILPLPIRTCITEQAEGDVTEHLPLILPYMPWAVALCALGLPFFLWGYYGQLARWLAGIVSPPKIGKNLRASFLVLTAIALFLLVLLARGSGGLVEFVLLGYGATSEMSGRGYLAVGFPWLWVATFFLLYRYSIHKAKADLVTFWLTAGINTLMAFIMGQRITIVYFGLAGLIFWHHAIKPISLRKLATLAALTFVSMNLVGFVRGSGFESFPGFTEKIIESASNISDESGGYTYTLTTGEFVVPFESLPQMIGSVGHTVNPQFGATYLRAPIFWIPSSIYPNRPLPLTNWYMQRFYGGGFRLNEGRAFFFLAEGYLNFGTLGVLATMFGWGVFLGVCRHYLRTNGRNPGAVLLYAFTIAFIMRGIAGDFVSVFVGLPEQILSAAILGLWIACRRQFPPLRPSIKLSVS